MVFDIHWKSIENSRILFGPKVLLEWRLRLRNQLSASMSSYPRYDRTFRVKWLDIFKFHATVKFYQFFSFTSTQPNATFYFTHSGTMLKLLSHLGLYKDDFTLTYREFDKNRKWRVGKIDAFASNLLFVSFEWVSICCHKFLINNFRSIPSTYCSVKRTKFFELCVDSKTESTAYYNSHHVR